jgi:hypothetical protein
VYKIFILCEKIGGNILTDTTETSDIQYYSLETLPPLSESRNVYSQIKMMFEYRDDLDKAVYLD